MLLIFDPFVLFVILRGSHEKMTWPLMMLALIMLYRSFGQPLRKMAIYVCLFYVIVFAIDTTNVFFGSVFLVAVVLSLTLGFLLFRFWRNDRPPLPRRDVQRLMYISFSGVILIFTFIAYIYPPALANLRMLQGIINQLSALLLSFEIKAQPYGYISTGWVNSQVYFILSAFTWLVIGVSFLEWIRHGWKMIKGQTAQGLTENLDWLLYTGFAIQIAVSIIVDYSGALAANVQLRLFPGFTVVAIVLIVRSLQRILTSSRVRSAPRWIAPAVGAGLAVWFILASLLKATNEPVLSNKWTFYLQPEQVAIGWIDTHLHDAELWIGVDERLATVNNSFYLMESGSENHFRFAKVRADMRYVFATDLDRLRAERLGVQWLPTEYWDQIYDNGRAQVNRIPLYILESP